MKKYIVALILFVASIAHAGISDTVNTVPSQNSSFITNLQNFLKFEDANRFSEQFRSFVVSGGTHSTAVGLTATPTSLVAYPGGYRTTESGSITYSNASTCFVIVHYSNTGNVSTFVRVAGTHYVVDCTSGVQPSLPANSAYLMSVTTAGGSITAVTDLRVTSPVANSTTLIATGTGPHVVGSSSTNALYQFLLTGTFTPVGAGDSAAFAINSAVNAGVNRNASLQTIAGTIVEAASGTHTILSSLRLVAPTITNGAATTTNAATLYIDGAPSGATNNYSIFVDAGASRFDGDIGDVTNRVPNIHATDFDACCSLTVSATGGTLAVGSSASIDTKALISGTHTTATGAASALRIETSVSGAASQDIYGLNVIPTLIEAGSGTHSLIAGSRFAAPTITGGVATVTDAATVYIGGAPTATVTGVNYAALVASGPTRLNGRLLMNTAVTSGSNANDIVLPNAAAIRFLNNAGTSSANQGIFSTSNALQYGVNSTSLFHLFQFGGNDGLLFEYENSGAGILLMNESSADHSAPAANRGVIYLKDVGGKTALFVRFATGAVQQIAIEP